ncbi:hypothetical protein HY772_05430 [Candidatus Woesearchaeota archaeon]|nr:hypothetical protein [Candidatus Woesearchaeota archaeon]
MTDLVAVLSVGKGTWGHVGRLIADGTWDNIFLITNEFGREKFTAEKQVTMMVVDSRGPMEDLINSIQEHLKGKLGKEVAINLISGDGKEHMALLAALNRMGVTFTLAALTKEGLKTL